MSSLAVVLIIIVAIVAIVLFNRNKDGGSSPKPSVPPAPTPTTRKELWYGYFGCFDGQISATKDHVNVVHIMDWCDYKNPAGVAWMRAKQIAWMKEAQAAGISKIILTVGYLTFEQVSTRLFRFKGIDELTAFKQELGVLADMVVALYLIDEPDLNGVSEIELRNATTAIRGMWSLPLAVIYSDHGTPAKDAFDIIGTSQYGLGAGILDRLFSLSVRQRHLLVPGGADPWRQDPQPFLAHAMAHTEVAWLCPFVWGNYGASQKGIFTNGMAEAYRKAGRDALGLAPAPAPAPEPAPAPAPSPAPAALNPSYPTAAALTAAAVAWKGSTAVTLDGKQIRGGFGPALAYYTQANGTVSTTQPTGTVKPPPAPAPAPAPTPAPQPAPSGTLATAYPNRAALIAALTALKYSTAVTLDGVQVWPGFGPATAYYTQADGTVSTKKPATPIEPLPAGSGGALATVYPNRNALLAAIKALPFTGAVTLDGIIISAGWGRTDGSPWAYKTQSSGSVIAQ